MALPVSVRDPGQGQYAGNYEDNVLAQKGRSETEVMSCPMNKNHPATALGSLLLKDKTVNHAKQPEKQ